MNRTITSASNSEMYRCAASSFGASAIGTVPNVGESVRPRAVLSSARLLSGSSGLVTVGTWICRPAMSRLSPLIRDATRLYSGNRLRTIWPLSAWMLAESPSRTATTRECTWRIAACQRSANASLA